MRCRDGHQQPSVKMIAGTYMPASGRAAEQYRGPCSVLTIDSCGWVVLDTQVNVLIDAKSKIACLAEVLPEKLILLYLQSALL